MEIYVNKQTAWVTAASAMPACGIAGASRSDTAAERGTTGWAGFGARDRAVAGVGGALGFAVATHIPGIHTWSPPIS